VICICMHFKAFISVPDPWHYYADTDPWIRTLNYEFGSCSFLQCFQDANKKYFFSWIFFAYYIGTVGTFTSVVRHSTALSYPSIENLFNGCQGHPPFCLPQGPPSGYRTGFKKCSDAQQFIQLTVVDDINAVFFIQNLNFSD
jgi:hypothetical protein